MLLYTYLNTSLHYTYIVNMNTSCSFSWVKMLWLEIQSRL